MDYTIYNELIAGIPGTLSVAAVLKSERRTVVAARSSGPDTPESPAPKGPGAACPPDGTADSVQTTDAAFAPSTNLGACMNFPENTRPLIVQNPAPGMPLRELARAALSWNLAEASMGVAAINAYYNDIRLLAGQKGVIVESGLPRANGAESGMGLRGGTETAPAVCREPHAGRGPDPGAAHCAEPGTASGTASPASSKDKKFDPFILYRPRYTDRKVGVIGHFAGLENEVAPYCDLSIFERDPRPGDYPDEAEDFLLPDMDYVFITGCTFANKSLPHILELCKKAFVILVGPSVPCAPLLFTHGVSVLSSLVFPRPEDGLAAVSSPVPHSFTSFGLKVNYERR